MKNFTAYGRKFPESKECPCCKQIAQRPERHDDLSATVISEESNNRVVYFHRACWDRMLRDD